MKTWFRLSLLAAVLLWTACRPTAAQPVLNGYVAVTCYSDGNPANPVVGLIDARQANLQPVYQHWPAPTSHGPASSPWNRANLGEVFGVTFDPAGNIYVSATTVYWDALPAPGGPGGGGAIYKLAGTTGAISVFATLPNASDIGLGNVAWDNANNQLFATNFEDGLIYRISSTGTILSTFAPTAPNRGRPWGIGVYNNHVYFGLWNEDMSAPSSTLDNEVWSVMLDGSGDFIIGSEQLEVITPNLPSVNYSNPVSDISFSAAGNMLLAERTMYSNTPPLNPLAHQSRVLEYSGSPWSPTGNLFSIGVLGSGGPGITASAAGGVDYAYDAYDEVTDQIIGCDEYIWASGDALRFDYPPSVQYVVYGFQYVPATGGSPATSVLIDADGDLLNQDKTQIGDIEVYKRCDLPDPCEDLTLEVTDLGDCCYELTVGGIAAGTLTSISANLLTAGVTFTGVIGPTGWSVTNTGTTASWDSAGIIPGGTVTGLRFCIQSTVSAPQTIEIVYHRRDGVECRDTITVDCDPVDPQPCFTVNDTTVRCLQNGPKGWTYDLSFSVTNYSPFSLPPYSLPAENVLVSSATPGLSVLPNNVALVPTLGYGQTSGTLHFTLGGSAAQPGDTVWVLVQLHGRRIQDTYEWCCPPMMVCFVLPRCGDCCDSVDINISQNSGRQVGNTAATISSGSVTVAPGPVTKVQASIMNVARSRVWCPDAQGTYVPVSAATSITGLITGATIVPAMPVSSGITPPTSEVIWGTVYSGVNFNPGSVNLNLSFPGTSLGWRCQDTLTICVRYTFTDTACRTCDTVVYYTVPRCGRIDIIADDPGPLNPISYAEALQGEGTSIGQPLYSDVVEGPALALSLSSDTQGRLSLSHWWQVAPVGIDKTRLVRMHVTPEAGIGIRSLNPVGSIEGATIENRTATIGLDLREGETDNFDVRFDNPTNSDFFSLRVRFDYVDLDEPNVELKSRQYIVYGDLTGGGVQGRIDISEADKSTPTLYKLLIGSNANHSADWIAPACFRFTPPEGVRILASGPMPDSTFAEFHVLKSMANAASVLMQIPAPGQYIKEYIPQQETVQLWLVLEGGGNAFNLDWEALNVDGSIIGVGNVELSPTSTVRDGDDYVPGTTINLLDAYPNPAQDRVTTRFTLARTGKVSVALFDVAGHEIARLVENESLSAGSHEYELNMKSLPGGAYYIRLTTETGTQTKSVVKK